MYSITRQAQGRVNDISLLLAMHAQRSPDGEYTAASKRLISTAGRYLRLFHLFWWAGFTARSKTRSMGNLLSKRGLTKLVEREHLTQSELATLQATGLATSSWHQVMLEWAGNCIADAQRAGTIQSNSGFDQVFLDKLCGLRGTAGALFDQRDGRMPLAYVHFVQARAAQPATRPHFELATTPRLLVGPTPIG